MNKMAIFVEGRTELEFDSKLIIEIARTTGPITIEARKRRGLSHVGKMAERIWVHHTGPDSAASTHFFLVYNCAGESTVKTRMIREYEHLVRAGYTRILCHRDLGPTMTYADLARFESGLRLGVKTRPFPPEFVLSVMGIEAWFLSEHTHFRHIDPTITVAAITAALKFDPSTDDMQLRMDPADDLDKCYALAGKHYDKLNTQPTIEALDYVSIYCEVADRFPHLRTLCREIEEFLAPNPAAPA